MRSYKHFDLTIIKTLPTIHIDIDSWDKTLYSLKELDWAKDWDTPK